VSTREEIPTEASGPVGVGVRADESTLRGPSLHNAYSRAEKDHSAPSFSSFLSRFPSKAQLDEPNFLRIDLSEAVQGLIEGDEIGSSTILVAFTPTTK
jgi:hypothetical protein